MVGLDSGLTHCNLTKWIKFIVIINIIGWNENIGCRLIVLITVAIRRGPFVGLASAGRGPTRGGITLFVKGTASLAESMDAVGRVEGDGGAGVG
jgi:hypothetical protein